MVLWIRYNLVVLVMLDTGANMTQAAHKFEIPLSQCHSLFDPGHSAKTYTYIGQVITLCGH